MIEWSRKLDNLVDQAKRQGMRCRTCHTCVALRSVESNPFTENASILRWICDFIPGRDHQDILVTAKMGSVYKDSGGWLFHDSAFTVWMGVDGLKGPLFWLSGSGMASKISGRVCIDRYVCGSGNGKDFARVSPQPYFKNSLRF